MTFIPETPGDEPLAQEKYLVKNAKKIGLLILGLAAQKFGKTIEKEQEILVNIADILSNVYAMDSVVLELKKPSIQWGMTNAGKNFFIHKFFAKRLFKLLNRMRRRH